MLSACSSLNSQPSHQINISIERNDQIIFAYRANAVNGQAYPISFYKETTYPSKIVSENDKETISTSSVKEGLEMFFTPELTNDNNMTVKISGSYAEIVDMKNFKTESGSGIQVPTVQTVNLSQTLFLKPNEETSFGFMKNEDKQQVYTFKITYVKS